jgi:hypothetical protein
MANDLTPKEKLQTKLFQLSQEQDKNMKNIYEEIGRFAITYQVNKDQIELKKNTLSFFEGVKNGLNQASSEVKQMIPDDMNEIYKTIVQLRNWIRSSTGTPSEDKEILTKANELVKMIGEE